MEVKKETKSQEKSRDQKPSTPTKKDFQSDILERIKQKTGEFTKSSFELTKATSSKIDESARITIQRAKEHPFYHQIKEKSSQATKFGIEKGKKIQKEGPRYLTRIKKGALGGLEEFVGAIRRGT